MSREPAEILNEALQLPSEARAAIAGSLLDSLDSAADENIEQSWRAEIEQRLMQLDGGTVELVPWDQVQTRLRARLER